MGTWSSVMMRRRVLSKVDNTILEGVRQNPLFANAAPLVIDALGPGGVHFGTSVK